MCPRETSPHPILRCVILALDRGERQIEGGRFLLQILPRSRRRKTVRMVKPFWQASTRVPSRTASLDVVCLRVYLTVISRTRNRQYVAWIILLTLR